MKLRHALMLFLKPGLFTAVVVVINNLVQFERSQFDSQMLASYVELLGGFHAVLAGFTIYGVGNEIPLLQEYADEGHMLKFVRVREKHILNPMHLLLGFFSFAVIFGACITYCYSALVTYFIVITSSMSVSLYWKVAFTLDNPKESGWFDGIEVPHPLFWTANRMQAVEWMHKHVPHIKTAWGLLADGEAA